MRVYVPLAATVLVGLLLASCSSTSKNQQAKDKTAIPVTDADEQVLKTDPIERNYDPHVIMKRAEAFFEKEDYAEAAVEYQHFLDLHRAHMLAPYAQYRLGLSHYKQVTTLDRDPEHVRQTIEAMEKLLKEYPGSAYELDAHTKIKEGREHLAAYEIYVGKHYYRQAAYLAVHEPRGHSPGRRQRQWPHDHQLRPEHPLLKADAALSRMARATKLCSLFRIVATKLL